LDNIQDLSFVGGPILRWFGLTLIKVETAGGGGQSHNSNMMSMIGIIDAEMFKNKILEQREIVKNKSNHSSHQIDNPLQHNLLQEIRNELVSIKNIMSQQAS
jgi:putative membrane protein